MSDSSANINLVLDGVRTRAVTLEDRRAFNALRGVASLALQGGDAAQWATMYALWTKMERVGMEALRWKAKSAATESLQAELKSFTVEEARLFTEAQEEARDKRKGLARIAKQSGSVRGFVNRLRRVYPKTTAAFLLAMLAAIVGYSFRGSGVVPTVQPTSSSSAPEAFEHDVANPVLEQRSHDMANDPEWNPLPVKGPQPVPVAGIFYRSEDYTNPGTIHARAPFEGKDGVSWDNAIQGPAPMQGGGIRDWGRHQLGWDEEGRMRTKVREALALIVDDGLPCDRQMKGLKFGEGKYAHAKPGMKIARLVLGVKDFRAMLKALKSTSKPQLVFARTAPPKPTASLMIDDDFRAEVGQPLYYKKGDGTLSKVTLVAVHRDESHEPYFTVRRHSDGSEVQTVRDRLRPASAALSPIERKMIRNRLTRGNDAASAASLPRAVERYIDGQHPDMGMTKKQRFQHVLARAKEISSLPS